ncbi:hypothetical protein JCM8547_009303 [Rhodosporidiobolus lusitaniae]
MADTIDDGFKYDSDEGYVGPSDEDEWDDGLYQEEEDQPPVVPLYSFRLPPMPAGPASEVLLLPELVNKLLVHLDKPALSAFSRVNSHFRQPAQSRLFRTVEVGSLSRLRRLFDIPHTVHHVRNATLSGWDTKDALLRLPVFAETFHQVEQGSADVDVEYRWASKNGDAASRTGETHTVVRPQWRVAWKAYTDQPPHRRNPPDLNKFTFQSKAVFKALDSVKAKEVETALRDDLSRWPFSPDPPSPLSFQPSFETLLSSLTSLTLEFPLSSFTANLFSSASCGACDNLVVRSGQDGKSSVDLVQRLRAIPPKSTLALRGDGQGLAKFPALATLDLDKVDLILPSIPSGSPAQEEDRTAVFTDITMTQVAARVERASLGGAGQRFIFRRKQKTPDDEVHGRDEPPAYLAFDFGRFVGAGKASLTRLHLFKVQGVVPSTIYSAIRLSGALLTYLHLSDTNSSFVTSTFEGEGRKYDFLTSSEWSDPRVLAAASARTRLPPSLPLDPSRTWPSDALTDALGTCTNLRTLSLDCSSNDSVDSPYSPDLIDTLLMVDPPLEQLFWNVSTRTAEGAVPKNWGEWATFEAKVRQFREVKALEARLCKVFARYHPA